MPNNCTFLKSRVLRTELEAGKQDSVVHVNGLKGNLENVVLKNVTQNAFHRQIWGPRGADFPDYSNGDFSVNEWEQQFP